jgi:hypothetical protein
MSECQCVFFLVASEYYSHLHSALFCRTSCFEKRTNCRL